MSKPVDTQEWIYTLKIKCKLQIADWQVKAIGLIDTGYSNIILNMKLVPTKFYKHLDLSEQFFAEQMDGKLYIYEYILAKYILSYSLGQGRYTQLTYVGRICLRLLTLAKTQFIIGLNPLINSHKGIVLTTDRMYFLTPLFPSPQSPL